MIKSEIECSEKHLDALRRHGNPHLVEKASIVPAKWMRGLPATRATPLHSEPVTRLKILNDAKSGRFETEELVVCILAWGGMRRHHASSLFREREWLRLASEIRDGVHSRAAAFERFSRLNTPGMGPAYFTKLIYFLMPREDRSIPPGFIMDQWLGCSVNLLFRKSVVLMDMSAHWRRDRHGAFDLATRFQVSPFNTSSHYEAFCIAIERIAAELTITPDQVEVVLFSEGRGNGAWRNYVRQHRCPPMATPT